MRGFKDYYLLHCFVANASRNDGMKVEVFHLLTILCNDDCFWIPAYAGMTEEG
jgi:hypothetical protein